MINKRSDKELNMFFLWGLVLGAICYFGVYGFSVLNPLKDGWLFKGDLDLKQHYVGWMAFRNSPWRFPIGLFDSLSYPYSMSVIYTDSIPLFAILFKVFRTVLPEYFQYFGIFAFISYMLQGGFASRLIARITNDDVCVIIYPACFVLSYPMLERTFYHTALGSQWIILLCFELWLSDFAYKSIRIKTFVYGFLGILMVFIHTYFVPIVLCILCGMELERIIKSGIKETATSTLLPLLMYVIMALLGLYILGAFTAGDSGNYWVGDFGMNLNSPVNSMGHGRFLPELPLYTPLQYEGSIYLGLGVLCAVIITAGMIVFDRRLTVKGLISSPRRVSIVIVAFIFLVVSTIPVYSFGDRLLFKIPFTRFMNQIVGIFRSNGRFAWPLMYLCFLFIPWIWERINKPVVYKILIPALVFIQLLDLSPWMIKKHDRFSSYKGMHDTMWDDTDICLEHDEVVSFIKDATFNIELGYYAANHNMKINRFYFARDIDSKMSEYEEIQGQKLLENKADKNVVYVFDEEAYKKYKDTGLNFFEGEDCIFGFR